MSRHIVHPLLASVLLATSLLALLPTGVEGIWCFQCNSMVDPTCPDIQPNQTSSLHYKLCEGVKQGYEPFCRKIVQKIHDRDGLIRVVRKCGWKKHPRLQCYKVSSVGHHDQVCQCFTDACNAGEKSAAVGVPALLLALAVAVWQR